MFDRVLIANRGEIAVRITRTLHRLGIEAVAIYSDADAGAPHVRAADRAVPVGPAPPAESYLNVARVVDAAVRVGADAVHPGYGFLSERPDFAQACVDAGLTFVGPSPEAMALLGDKIAAKDAAAAAGVPIVPGLHKEALSDEDIISWAEDQELPLLLKAAAGGGGIGMRVVRSRNELPDALSGARREAQGAFGDDRLLVERYLERPRHIEVQVIADTHGNVLHLGERECSLQRRHQKVIEEAPSPVVDAALRSRMGAAATGLARACGYTGAGTVELLADKADPSDFYFLEMNARLQVEHPVTELVTGLDLVELQLRIAAGEQLPVRQDDVELNGHAVEARVYAEDPASGFLPSSGRVVAYREPAGVRVDSGVAVGSEVSSHYDPMLAKVIAHGPDRLTAMELLGRALGEIRVVGPTTNIAYLRALLAWPAVCAGDLDTSLLERLGGDIAPPPPDPSLAAFALVALLGTPRSDDPWDTIDGWLVSGRAPARALLEGPEGEVEAIAQSDGAGGWTVGQNRVRNDGDRLSIEREDGSTRHLEIYADGSSVWLLDDGSPARFALVRDRSTDQKGTGSLEALMPGMVIEVRVQAGATVEEGEVLVLLESMKMEMPVRSPRDGIVDDVYVSSGQRVSQGQQLITLTDVASDLEEDQ
jgi:acetyl-CoA/propionyl-CoA carboxylase, biotin carboxylase, biotin carboxyl carrier protein